ncbi:uncharacterized protein LOC144425135 [Styela clava]
MPSNIRDQDREPEVLEREINMPQNTHSNTAATEYNEDDVMVKSSTNQVSIKPHDREKVLHNMIIFLNPSSTTPEIGSRCDSHKNVALEFSQTEILYKDMKLSSLDIYKMNLQQHLAEGTFPLSDNFIMSILLQVTEAIDHLHKIGKTFGRITAEHIYLSCREQSQQDSPKIVLTESRQAGDESGEVDKAKDIAFLGDFFEYLLTKVREEDETQELLQCSDEGTVKDLIDRMLEKRVDTNGILRHPFFWSVKEKINFLCDAYDSIKYRDIEESLGIKGESVTGKNWFEKLKLSPIEKTKIENALKLERKMRQINPNTILNLAKSKTQNCSSTSHEYKNDSLCELMQFFRNRKAHYWESKQPIKHCFQSYPDGFWKFFSSRYPDLLPFVYEHRLMFMGPPQNA